jgi:hypothetical protein
MLIYLFGLPFATASSDGAYADKLSILLEQALHSAIKELTHASNNNTESNKQKKPRKRASTVETLSRSSSEMLQHASASQIKAKNALPHLITDHATVLIRLGR